MTAFVKYLTDHLHARVPGSIVLWYDSVTTAGKLQWQNMLNTNNKRVVFADFIPFSCSKDHSSMHATAFS